MSDFRQQFARPEGWQGQVAGWLMAVFNRKLADWAVQQLALAATDRVLEIGFGPGVAIQEIAARVPQGRVAGVDISPLMVQQARKRNHAAIYDGIVELQEGSVARLPYGNESFDKLVAINATQFFTNQEKDFQEMNRVLRRGGKIVVIVQDRGLGTLAEVKAASNHVMEAIRCAGFEATHSEIQEMRPVPAYAITAKRWSG